MNQKYKRNREHCSNCLYQRGFGSCAY